MTVAWLFGLPIRLALRDGVPFYMSVNEVILSPGIEGLVALKYVLGAQDLKTKKIFLEWF